MTAKYGIEKHWPVPGLYEWRTELTSQLYGNIFVDTTKARVNGQIPELHVFNRK